MRRLCKHCKQPYEASPDECKLLDVDPPKAPTLHRSVGCDLCEFQGFKGRLAIGEILKFDPEIDEMISHRATQRELLRAAVDKGFKTLADDAIRRALDGSTSLDEVLRIVDLTDRM